ncbi:MAG: hypothetical protein ACXAC8_04790 [Candidatus Hodarchaeales archaeon]|jgi:hypothetical protein
MSSKNRKRTLYTPASIAASAFNLPVMVIAGVIIGYFLSVDQNTPIREVIQIGIPILFFIIAMFELYYTINKRQMSQVHSKSSSKRLIDLILEDKNGSTEEE